MTMQGGTARDRLRARAQAMYGGKRREDEEQQNRKNQRQEVESPAVGSARDRLRQRASTMGVVTGQGANAQEPAQERSRLTVEGYETAIKGMQERMGGQTGLTKSDIVRHTQSRETEKWRQEQAKKYSGLRDQADYAKKSTKVDQSLASGKGAYIFGHYVGKGDDVYSYINSIGTAYENRSNAGKTPSGKLAKYAYMTDDEVADYNYLYQTKGKEEAEKYLEYMGPELDARRAAGFSQWNSELAEKAPHLASAVSVPMRLTSGVGLVDVGLQNIRNQVTGEYKPINYYSPAMDATVASTAIRGTRAQQLTDKYGKIQMDEKEHPLLSRIFNGKSWGDVYQLGMSMVDSAAAAGIGKGTGLTAAGTALLGGSAGSQGVLDAVERGATDSQALTMGILNATFESLFEYVSLDHLLKGNTKNILKGFLKQGFIEGSEEWNTTLFNTIADVLVMAENSDYKTSVRDYMEQGYSEKEAERQAMFDIAVGMGWDFVGGAISGGLMDTGKQVVRDATYKSKFGKASGDIVAEAQEVAPGTALTQKAQERIDAGKSLTGHQIVNLLQQNEDAIRTGDMVTIRNAVADRLAQYGESQNIDRLADAITKQVAGEKLSGKEKALVENSTYGQRVLNEMDPENISEGGFNSDWAGQLGTTQINAEAYSQKLREAQAETQQEEPQQTERKEMTPEEMAVLSAWNSEAESSPANSTTVQPNLGDREVLETLGVKTGSQLRAEVRKALTERQDVAQEVQQRTQAAQQTQETQETAQRAQGEPVTLEEASKAYGKQAKAFLRTYQQGQDVEKFSEAYRIAHEMGKSDVPYRVVQGLRSLDYLTEAQKDIAYRTGASAEQQERGGKKATWRRQGVVRAENGANLSDLSKTFNVPQKQGYRILSDIAKATGVDIVLYRSKGDAEGNITEAEGRFRRSENTIYIDVNSGIDNVNSAADFSQYTMLRTFNHEFTHFIEQNADEEYRDLRKLVFEAMQEKLDGQKSGVTVDDLIREKQDKYRQALGQEISYDDASREVVADAMTDILPDSHFMETLYNRNATLAEKLIGKLKDFIAKVRAYFDGLTTNTKAEAALLKEMRDGGLHYLESIVEAYDKAATAAVENYQGSETRSEGGENQYMARGKYWRPQLKQAEWDLLEWRMNAEIKSGENFLDEATKWVYADEKGVQVFALYGIGDGTDATPLYAVGGKKAAAYNAAMNEFMERSQKYDGDGRSVDPLSELPWRKEGSRSGNLSQTSRKAGDAEGVSELHGGSQRSDSGRASGRGTENQRGVKDQFLLRDSEGRILTEAQQEYFKDSKVRDAEGNLLVMYHQTDGTFTVFDTKHKGAGSGDDETPFGIFLKRTSRNIGVRGEKQMELYADIRNPLRVRDRTELVSKLRELSVDYARLKDESAQIDKEYGAKFEEAKNAFKNFLIQWRKNNPDAPQRAAYDADGFDDAFNAEDNVVKEWTRAKDELALRAKTAITQALRDNGYDGVFLENDKGSWGRSTDAYIALDANQVKNTTNKSPTADTDIRYSIRDSEGRSLTEAQQDYFKDSKVRDAEGRLKVVYHGSGAVFTKFSADFMSQNGSAEGQGFYFTDYKPMAEGYSKKGGQLLEGYLDMKNPLSDSEVTLTYAEVRKLIKAIDPTGDDLVLNYDSKGGMGYPSREWYNRSVEDTLRATMSTSDSDSEILAELANGMGDPGAVLKAAREVLGYDGYIVEGKYDNATVYVAFDSSQFKNVDNQSPTADPDIRYSIRETAGKDMPDKTESQAQIRSSTLSDRDVLRIAAQMAKNSESRSLTDADRARLGIIEQKLVRIDEAEEQRQGFLEEKRAILAGREAKELSDAERAQLRKVQKDLDTVNGKIRRLNEELSQTQEKKVVKELLKKARVVVERDAVQRSVSSYRETRQRAEYMGKLRRSVERNAKRLQEMLLTNTDKKHVPEALKKPVAELLRSMNLISKRGLAGGAMTKADERYVKALRGIQDVLARQSLYEENGEGDDLIGGYLDLPAGFQMLLNAYVSKVEKAIEEHPLRNGVLQTMTVEELEETNTVLSVISTAVTEMNKLMVNRQFATVVDAAEDTIWALNEHEQHQKKTGENFLVWDNCLPWYAFQRFGEGGKSIFQGLMNGWDKLSFNTKKVLDFRNGLIDDKTARKWDTETHTVMLENSKGGQEEVTLTTAQLMSLYCLSRRKQAMGHLMGGGIRIASIDIAEEIESARAAEEGKPVREKKKKKKDVDQAEHYLLTQGELGRLLSLLTPEQVQAAKAMQKYMTEQGSAWGNEVSMRRFGYRAFTEENYFPIETDSQDRPAKTDSKEGSLYRLLNLSAVKPLTEGANNAIMVRSIFDVFANHMADMAKYNALALPVLDAQKWYNYKDSSKNKDNGQVRTRTVQREMTRAWGSGANNYVVTFLKDINGVKENGARGEGMAAKAISKYKRAAVAANLRVAMLQPTSYVRASAVIDHKYLAKALTKKVITKAEGQEMLQYSGVALWKEMGFFDTDVGRSIRDRIKGKGSKIEDLVDKSMAAAQAGDKITWERLWLACKLEVEEKRHLTGEELMEATAERFREVIYRTQVVDSTMTRSHMMRDGGTFSKIATSFMSESTVSYNMLMNSTLDTLQDAQSMGMQKAVKKNWRQLGLAYQAYILAGAASAIAGALADALRDWDDDSFLEKFWKAFWGEKPETVKDQVLNLMLGLEGNLAGELNPLGKIPLIRDVTNTFGGFSTDRMDMAAWSNLYSLLGIWEETIGLWTGSLDKATKTTYYGNMTTYNKIYKTAQVVSQFTGLPISATMRELVTMWNSTVGLAYPGTKVRTYESRKVREAYEQYGKSVGLSYVMILRAAEAVRQLESDKDEDGNAISGSLKKKYVEYIQSLHLSAKQEKAMWNCIKKASWSDKDTPWGK